LIEPGRLFKFLLRCGVVFLAFGIFAQIKPSFEQSLGAFFGGGIAGLLSSLLAGTGQSDRARAVSERFLHIWQEADPDILEVIAAKARLADWPEEEDLLYSLAER
jgi:hypothetical protein